MYLPDYVMATATPSNGITLGSVYIIDLLEVDGRITPSIMLSRLSFWLICRAPWYICTLVTTIVNRTRSHLGKKLISSFNGVNEQWYSLLDGNISSAPCHGDTTLVLAAATLSGVPEPISPLFFTGFDSVT